MRNNFTFLSLWLIWVLMLILWEKSPLQDNKSLVVVHILVIYILTYQPFMKELAESMVKMDQLLKFQFFLCLMTISPIQFQILQVISPKVKFSSIDNSITNKFIHQSMFYLHFHDWWRKPLKKIDLIMLQFLTNFMLTMLQLKIQQPWRQLLVNKP